MWRKSRLPSRLALLQAREDRLISQSLLLCALVLQRVVPRHLMLVHHYGVRTRLAPLTGFRNSSRLVLPRSPRSHLPAATLRQDDNRFPRLYYRLQSPRIVYPAPRRHRPLPKKRHTALSQVSSLKIAHHHRWARAIVGRSVSSIGSHRYEEEARSVDTTTD
jgi:hypothetical protein